MIWYKQAKGYKTNLNRLIRSVLYWISAKPHRFASLTRELVHTHPNQVGLSGTVIKSEKIWWGAVSIQDEYWTISNRECTSMVPSTKIAELGMNCCQIANIRSTDSDKPFKPKYDLEHCNRFTNMLGIYKSVSFIL